MASASAMKPGAKCEIKPTSGSTNAAKLSTTASATSAATTKKSSIDSKQKNLEHIVLESNVISAVLQRGSVPASTANKPLNTRKSVPEVFEETKTSMLPSSSFDSDKNPTLRRDKVRHT